MKLTNFLLVDESENSTVTTDANHAEYTSGPWNDDELSESIDHVLKIADRDLDGYVTYFEYRTYYAVDPEIS